MGLHDFREAMEINYFGVLNTTLAALPHMRERRSGRIVNIASIGGAVAIPHLTPYSASKFAVVGLSQGLCAELRPYGIRVTTILPGVMRTGSFVNALFKGRQEREMAWFSASSSAPRRWSTGFSPRREGQAPRTWPSQAGCTVHPWAR